jgi:HD-GYP domain-containing protein (c-di-GMP phosphodiesterase class II)
MLSLYYGIANLMELSQQHYLGHLTEVSKNNKVILVDDVFNERGMLVVKKGVEVDKIFAKKIAKHKLLKPLDHSISLTFTLNQRTSFEIFTQRLNDMQLSDIVRHNGMYQYAIDSFHLLTQYPLVTQKLTVLAERMPDVFARSLLTSVIAISLCKELKLSKKTAENVFLANIISDVGLLHIDPLIVNKEGQYTQCEWKMMQGHVVIAKHFADMVPNLSRTVGLAILEHHERADGFGYPFSKHAEQLGIEGQILAMVDKVSAIYRKLVKNGPHSWTSVIAVVQLPSTAHPKVVHKGIMRLLNGFSVEYIAAFSELEFKLLVVLCIEKRERLNLWFKEFARIYVDHKDLMKDSENFKPLALLHQLEYTVIDSGVLSQAQHTWLSRLEIKLSKIDFVDIEEFALLLDEVEYQSLFVMRKLVASKDELEKRFNGHELPSLYYQGLMNILDPDDKQNFS